MIDRRAFLAQAAAAPLVFGLADLAAQEAKEPPWLAEALGRMKRTGRWGVVIVAPPGDRERRRLGRALYALTELDDEDHEAHRIFCEAVVIAMTPEAAAGRFPRGANRVLLGPDGAVLASGTVEPALFEDPAKFAESFEPFVHGEKRARLVERAEAIEKGLPEDARKALGSLGAESAEERLQAVLVLSRRVESITPCLVRLELLGRGAEERRQARLLLLRYFATFPAESFGSRLPYGSYMPKLASSCGHWVLEGEPQMGCGMGRVPKKSGRFVLFLGK